MNERDLCELLPRRIEQVPPCTRPFPIDGFCHEAAAGRNQSVTRKGSAGGALAEPVVRRDSTTTPVAATPQRKVKVAHVGAMVGKKFSPNASALVDLLIAFAI
jgi:hypothetical protein